LILPIFVCLVFLLIVIICMFFVAFVLFTYLPLTVTNLLFNMFSVLFLAIVTLIKGFVCYDANANKLRISRNVIFSFLFLNQYFFSSHPNPISSSILLPPFDDVSSTPRFKPSIVYQRRRPLPLPSFAPPPDPILHEPHRSTRVS
jgi:hypothetical protein